MPVAHFHNVVVNVIVIVKVDTGLCLGQNPAGTSRVAGGVGAMGVGFKDMASAINESDDHPVLIDVAVGGGATVGDVFNLFAAAPEGVVAV